MDRKSIHCVPDTHSLYAVEARPGPYPGLGRGRETSQRICEKEKKFHTLLSLLKSVMTQKPVRYLRTCGYFTLSSISAQPEGQRKL